MAYGDNITEGLPYPLSNPNSVRTYQISGEAYDLSINGQPFFMYTSDETPYRRQTAPYRKDQFDSSSEPGEQSLTGWWLRSQSSFHSGMGIKFYDTQRSFSSVDVRYTRYTDSRNVDVWTQGQVTLLKETANMPGVTTGIYKLISAMSGSTDVVIGYIPGTSTIKSFQADGTVITTYTPTGLGNILDGGVCTDGTRLFVADSDHIYVGPLNAASVGWSEYYATGSRVKLAWVKQRLVPAVTNSIYELTGATGSPLSLPTPVYTHPNTSWVWTSISESGGAIYASGYAGGNSAIYKFTLSSNGSMPVLTSGVIAAQLPIGEFVNKIEYYLGYLMIGTNKGVRAANVSDQDGSINYGPLIIEISVGVEDFAFRDTYVWLTGSIGGYAGLYRIDLDNEIDTLRFAYATDAYLDGVTGHGSSVDFIGNSSQIAFTTSGSNGIAVQSSTVHASSGYLQIGKIRYDTLEDKVFKIIKARVNNADGAFNIKSIDSDGNEYSIGNFDAGDFTPEVNVTYPVNAQEYMAFKFTLSRSATDSTKGPKFFGYQLKALPAVARKRIIQYPIALFDNEKDKNGVQIGYDGSAYERLSTLEAIESAGDSVRVDDFRTGESYIGIIEEINFVNRTPTGKRFTGFGGVLLVTIRSL